MRNFYLNPFLLETMYLKGTTGYGKQLAERSYELNGPLTEMHHNFEVT